MRSDWHNLPTLGGALQEAGAEYAARDVELETSGEETGISMEIAGAWSRESGVKSYRRRVRLHKGLERITVEDRYLGAGPAVLSLITELRPEARDGGIAIGDLAFAALSRITSYNVCYTKLLRFIIIYLTVSFNSLE